MEAIKQKPYKKLLREGAFWLIIFVATLFLFIFFKPHLLQSESVSWARNGVVGQCVTAVIAFIAIIVGLFLHAYKKLNYKTVIILMLIIGFAVRVGYMLYTPPNQRQYDTQTSGHDGHEAYAWIIYSTGKLPTHNGYQFYHPPLNALFQAGFMHFFSGFSDFLTKFFGLGDYFPMKFIDSKPDYLSAERWMLFSSCQILSVIYSMVACVYSIKIIKMFNFSDKLNLFLYAFVIFFPRNYQFSAQLNNDALSYTISILALYYCLKWFKCGKNYVDIGLCALFVGLGLMTKVSSATVCLPIAGLFIYELVMVILKKSDVCWVKMLIQYSVFALIAIPIGFWFHIYANIKFDQKFGYVFNGLADWLYTGDKSIMERFIFAFDWEQWFGSPFASSDNGYFLFTYLVRTSMFWESASWQGESFALVGLMSAYLACLLIIIDIIYCLTVFIKKRRRQEFGFGFKAVKGRLPDFIFIFLLIFSQVVGMYYFYIKMPYGCTMDFRYIMPMILGLALGLSYIFKSLKYIQTNTSNLLTVSTASVIITYLLSTTLFYFVCI